MSTALCPKLPSKEPARNFPDQAGMLREPTAKRIYGVARVQLCDVYHELLQLPSHEAERLRVFRNKIRRNLVGNMYRVRVLDVQLLGECSVARSFAGQEMKALIVDLESGLGNRLAKSLSVGRPAWLRHVPDVAVRLPALHAVCVASWQWPSLLIPDLKTRHGCDFRVPWYRLGVNVGHLPALPEYAIEEQAVDLGYQMTAQIAEDLRGLVLEHALT